jgi:hypothetical protein
MYPLGLPKFWLEEEVQVADRVWVCDKAGATASEVAQTHEVPLR